MDQLALRAIATIGIFCGLVAALNWEIDPFELHYSLRSLNRYKHVPTMSAPAKLALLDRLTCERILVGSSRVEFALDPEDPHWLGMETCNLGISGSSIRDQISVILRAQKTGHLKEVIWGLDFQAFSRNHRQLMTDSAPPAILSWNYLRQSAAVIARAVRGERTGYTDRGFIARPGFKALSLTRFRNDIRDYLNDRGLYARYELDFNTFSEIKQLRSELAQNRIKLKLLVLPVHAVHLEILRVAKLERMYEQWLEDLNLKVGPVLDFSSYSFPNDERIPNDYKRMHWFWDSNHITREYGGLIIEELYNPAPRYARTRVSFEPRDDRQAWIERNTETLAKLGLR